MMHHDTRGDKMLQRRYPNRPPLFIRAGTVTMATASPEYRGATCPLCNRGFCASAVAVIVKSTRTGARFIVHPQKCANEMLRRTT